MEDVKIANIEIIQLPLKEYFRKFELILHKKVTLDWLTNLLTNQPFTETKPYLYRRHLHPIDNRFNEIEIVYYDNKQIGAIFWYLPIKFSQLKDFFGEPIIHNEPYDNSTAFAFKSNNPDIEVIETRSPYWLKELKNSKSFEYRDENGSVTEIIDPEFNFVAYKIKD